MVSVIIPIYNQCKHLKQCISSCINQSYADLEIILINDASTDDSLSICNHFCDNDTRIKLINKVSNEGVEIARFDGYNIAKGKYILFVDADDWLCDQDIIRKMVYFADKTNSDYVECGNQRTIDRWNLISQSHCTETIQVLKQPQLYDNYFVSYFGRKLLNTCMWGKLYRKSSFENITLSPLGLKMGEDLAFNLRLFPYLHQICILPDVGYSYRWGGITTRYNPHFFQNCKYLFILRKEIIENSGYDKAWHPLCEEMIDVLITQISMTITFKADNKHNIIKWIKSELDDSIYDQICDILENNISTKFERALKFLKAKNAIGLYKLGKKHSNSNKYLMSLKKLLYNIVNIL